jgi:hypothetical protein
MDSATIRIIVRILCVQLSLRAHRLCSLERNPPIPTLQGGPQPIHHFLGYRPQQHLLSLTVRDPSDAREMPANTKDYINATCVRGVRKVRLR